VDFPFPRRVTEASGSVVEIYFRLAVPDLGSSSLPEDLCSSSNPDYSSRGLQKGSDIALSYSEFEHYFFAFCNGPASVSSSHLGYFKVFRPCQTPSLSFIEKWTALFNNLIHHHPKSWENPHTNLLDISLRPAIMIWPKGPTHLLGWHGEPWVNRR
jgi:hypothetical protein